MKFRLTNKPDRSLKPLRLLFNIVATDGYRYLVSAKNLDQAITFFKSYVAKYRLSSVIRNEYPNECNFFTFNIAGSAYFSDLIGEKHITLKREDISKLQGVIANYRDGDYGLTSLISYSILLPKDLVRTL